MKKETYKMKFKCWNCGHTWEEEIKKRHLIGGNFSSDGIYEEINEWGGKLRYIVCPNCKTQKEVKKMVDRN